ncbi:MAG: DUF5069 domain-containing protein [Chthoniobacteraceae bacterium]
MNIPNTDLTTRPPRSARARLGGYALLPRMLDKGRAELLGKSGDYHYNCPLDQHILNFIGLDHEALKAELATGKGDGEILEWINANAKHQRTPWEIAQWSAWREQAVPTDVETREFFNGMHKDAGAKREDIATWADVLDLDDYVSFGGKA